MSCVYIVYTTICTLGIANLTLKKNCTIKIITTVSEHFAFNHEWTIQVHIHYDIDI